jgi:hypothetical protein
VKLAFGKMRFALTPDPLSPKERGVTYGAIGLGSREM